MPSTPANAPLCPTPHGAPNGGYLCPTCGAPVGDPTPDRRGRDRRFAAIAVLSVVGAVAAAAVVIALVMARGGVHTATSASEHAELTEWWSTTYPHVTELQEALDDSRKALESLDGPALASACQRMHDAARVDLAAQMPSPEADLKAELDAAADDAHEAAHMCLSVLEHSPNNYDAEFTSDVDQSERHLEAGIAIVNRSLTREPRKAARH